MNINLLALSSLLTFGFTPPVEPTYISGDCHPATAAWDYEQLLRRGVSHELAWHLAVTPYHYGTPECQIKVKTSIDWVQSAWPWTDQEMQRR